MLRQLEKLFFRYETAENIAERALSECENSGMLPPTAEFKPLEYTSEGFDPGPKSLYANVWEPEDE